MENLEKNEGEQNSQPVHTCCNCNEEVNDNNRITQEGDDYCEQCYSDKFFCCDGCDNTLSNEDMNSQDDGCYCESCFADIFASCHSCGSVHKEDSDEIRYSEFGSQPYCTDCFYERFAFCDDCGSEQDRDSICYDENRGVDLCVSCYDQHEEKKGIIKDYSYKPQAVFFGKNDKTKGAQLFAGFELEIETQNRKDNSDLAEKIDRKELYFKTDGSLTTGFEIISHPFTFDYLKNNDFLSFLDTLKSEGAKSYDTDTCGMHVHLSKNFFTTARLYRFLTIFYEFKNFVFKISQRKTIEKMNRWATLDDLELNQLRKVAREKKKDGDRYTAVNLKPDHTIEVRIFRGTLKKESFLKNIEFCFALAQFSAKKTPCNLNDFLKFVKTNEKKYSNLQTFLTLKNILPQLPVQNEQLTEK